MDSDSKNIFMYWHSGERFAPLIHRMNIDNIRRRTEGSGWRLVVCSLDEQSEGYVENFIELPEYFFEMREKLNDKTGMGGNQSDLVRLRLLAKYGGAYFDTSTILLKDRIEDIRLYSDLLRSTKARLAGYTNYTFTRKKDDGSNYFGDVKDGLELGVLFAKRGSEILDQFNCEIDNYWRWKTKGRSYVEYPPFSKYKLSKVSFLNEYHVHYTIFHMLITRENHLLEELITQSIHMKGKESSKEDGPYAISDRFCRDCNGYGTAIPEKLLRALLPGDVRMFDGTMTTLKDRLKYFERPDLLLLPGYMRNPIAEFFQSEADYHSKDSAYKIFYRIPLGKSTFL